MGEDGAIEAAREVPLYPGSTFGWRLGLGCTAAVEVREELRLPAPGDWGTDPDLEISRDRRTARIASTVPCEGGSIEKLWSVSPHDPPGVWIIRVKARGFATQTFRARFVPADPPP